MKKDLKSKWIILLTVCCMCLIISAIIFLLFFNKNQNEEIEGGIKFHFTNELNCKADSIIEFKYQIIDSCDINIEMHSYDVQNYISKEKVIFSPFYKKILNQSGEPEITFLPLLISNRFFGDYYTAFWISGKVSNYVIFNSAKVQGEGQYFFNNKGTPCEIYIWLYNKNENHENSTYKAVCEYNDRNQVIERSNFTLDEDENWIFDSREIYEYGKNDLLETVYFIGHDDVIFAKEYYYYQDIDNKNNWTKRVIKKEFAIDNYASWQKEVRYIYY